MTKKILIAATAVILCLSTWASSPEWKRVNHIGSTIFTGVISIDGKPAPATAYVGAFVGSECRMIAPIIMSNDTAYVSSVIHGDTPENVLFKIWTAPGQEKSNTSKMQTKPGESILMHRIDF